MTPKFFIGIDISKLTLDVAVLSGDTLLKQYKIENSEVSVKKLLATLKSTYFCTPANAIYCAENMGIYAKFLLNVLVKRKIRICLESPLQIKLSLGIQRGKNDALDALLIAQYACKNYSDLKFWQPPRASIGQLRALSTLRKKLIKIRVMLLLTKTAEAHFLSTAEKAKIGAYYQLSLESVITDIKRVEAQIKEVISADQPLNNLVSIVTSVPRIGIVVAVEIIIHTNEFKDITCPKKFASYCGIAPFTRTSGTSLKGRSKVSHLANKNIKQLLHLAALGAARKDQSTKLSDYYHRKVEEGKHKMCVLNAIRNKLVHYIFACVRENKLFEEYA